MTKRMTFRCFNHVLDTLPFNLGSVVRVRIRTKITFPCASSAWTSFSGESRGVEVIGVHELKRRNGTGTDTLEPVQSIGKIQDRTSRSCTCIVQTTLLIYSSMCLSKSSHGPCILVNSLYRKSTNLHCETGKIFVNAKSIV